MWKHVASLAISMLVGLPAIANADCPELTRLRVEAAQASAQMRGPPALLGRCESYTRISIAWNDVAKYASDHRDACDVSDSMLDTIENAHRQAVKTRDRVCMGLPVLSYPADIIRR